MSDHADIDQDWTSEKQTITGGYSHEILIMFYSNAFQNDQMLGDFMPSLHQRAFKRTDEE